MKHGPSIFDQIDEAAEVAAEARALEDIREGRLISHDAVKKWLTDYIDGTRRPRPNIGE